MVPVYEEWDRKEYGIAESDKGDNSWQGYGFDSKEVTGENEVASASGGTVSASFK